MGRPHPRRDARTGAGRCRQISRPIHISDQLSAARPDRSAVMTLFPSLRRILAAALLVLVPALPARAEVAFQQITSPKGISAWLVEDYSVPLVTIRFSFMGGSSQDP